MASETAATFYNRDLKTRTSRVIISEDKAKMPRRPNIGNGEQLTPAELADLQGRLQQMSRSDLEIFYKATHNACRYVVAGRLPSPRLMQELVQAWKVLRNMHER